MRAVERLAQHAEIVVTLMNIPNILKILKILKILNTLYIDQVVHDTEQSSYNWPADWEQSKNSKQPIMGGRCSFE